MGILSLPGFHVHELLSTRAAEFASCRGGSGLLGAVGFSTWASSPACIRLSVFVSLWRCVRSLLRSPAATVWVPPGERREPVHFQSSKAASKHPG